MKHYQIIALIAAAVGMASCDEYTLPNPPAQSNPEEAIFTSTDLVFTSTADNINLPELVAENSPVHLFDLTVTNFPAGYSIEVEGEFCQEMPVGMPVENLKTMTAKLNVTDNNAVTISTAELQTIFNSVVSKDIVARYMNASYIAYAVNGTSRVRLGGPDYYYWTGGYNVTPLPQPNVIETAYYLVGNFCDWDVTKGIPFAQLNEGNPYDNPEFTIKIDVNKDLADSEDGYQWMIVGKSGYDSNSLAGAFGVNGTDTEGVLVDTDDAAKGVIRQEGPYMIKLNMEAREYSVGPAFEALWVPGMATATADNKFDQVLRLETNDYINYEGTMPLRSRFWFTGQASTKGVSFRPDADQVDDENGGAKGTMVYDVTTNTMMKVAQQGLYYVKANVVTLEWSITPIPQISIIGKFNDWNTGTAVDLTPDSKYAVWTVTDIELPADEFKFCVSHDWALSYGGELDDVRQNAGNFILEEAGVYDVVLNFGVSPATLTLIKK